jgi:hypothetical protein
MVRSTPDVVRVLLPRILRDLRAGLSGTATAVGEVVRVHLVRVFAFGGREGASCAEHSALI